MANRILEEPSGAESPPARSRWFGLMRMYERVERVVGALRSYPDWRTAIAPGTRPGAAGARRRPSSSATA